MNKGIIATLLFVLMVSLTSCSVVTGIFKAGVWAGILFVVVIVAIVIFVISKLFGGGNKS